ncbi:MAG TPA: HepT-like ribonuclease domain-containing protein [Rhizomicrobium sp.]|nr:HepT-like ribonuclease domain-containing protein [Rhizomicrobium sp.]
MSFSEDDKTARAIATARHNIQLIHTWAGARSLDELKTDTLVRYAIERAFIAIDSSIKDIPADLLARHGVPAGTIAGFRNALAHTYDDILDQRVILTIRQDLPELDAALAAMLAAL